MYAEQQLIDSGLRAWKFNADRIETFFHPLSEDELQQEIAPGRSSYHAGARLSVRTLHRRRGDLASTCPLPFGPQRQDGTPDVYFHLGTMPSPQIAGVFYIDVSGGQRTLKSRDHGELQWMMNIERVWADKLYLYPVSASDLAVNPALRQDPGW